MFEEFALRAFKKLTLIINTLNPKLFKLFKQYINIKHNKTLDFPVTH